MNIIPKATITYSCSLTLTEDEARAMEALAGYNHDVFIQVFYEHLGEHYMRPHELGLRSVLEACCKQLRPQLSTVDSARALIKTIKSS